jgi:hypothetical protein
VSHRPEFLSMAPFHKLFESEGLIFSAFAGAVVQGLGEGARTRDGAATVIEPVCRDVPAGDLGLGTSIRYKDQYDIDCCYSSGHQLLRHPTI